MWQELNATVKFSISLQMCAFHVSPDVLMRASRKSRSRSLSWSTRVQARAQPSLSEERVEEDKTSQLSSPHAIQVHWNSPITKTKPTTWQSRNTRHSRLGTQFNVGCSLTVIFYFSPVAFHIVNGWLYRFTTSLNEAKIHVRGFHSIAEKPRKVHMYLQDKANARLRELDPGGQRDPGRGIHAT